MSKKETYTQYVELFYQWLAELGYDRREPLDPYQDTMNKMITITHGNWSMDLNQFVAIWPNKDSYVFMGMLDDMDLGLKPHEVKYNMQRLCYDVCFIDQSRVCELGWQWRTPQHQATYPNDIRYKLLLKFFKYAHADIANASWGEGRGIDGDTIVVYPFGDKDYKTWTTESRELGTKQRQSMAKRFGFSSLSEEGCMYATYRQGKLHPW